MKQYIINSMKQGYTVTNNNVNYRFEYDDDGSMVVEVYNTVTHKYDIISRHEFESNNNFDNFKVAA